MPRVLKLILAALLAVIAVVGSVFFLVALAVGGLVFLLIRAFRRKLHGHRAEAPKPRARPAEPDVIEVAATEVPDPESRPRELDR